MILSLRNYQQKIVDRVNELSSSGKNSLIELDCGLGKRVITYELLTETFADSRIILFVTASSSLDETFHYLTKEYGGVEGLELINSRQPTKLRIKKIQDARVVLTLPQTLRNTLRKDPSLAKLFDVIIINEVDKLVRRSATTSLFIQPWQQLIDIFAHAQVIGMSGTIRDEHVILDQEQANIRAELDTLQELITNSTVIPMTELEETDLADYINVTDVKPYGVTSLKVQDFDEKLTSEITRLKNKIIAELEAREVEFDRRNIFTQFAFLPISDKEKERMNKLLLLRKYLFSMPYTRFKRLSRIFNLGLEFDFDNFFGFSMKTLAVHHLTSDHNKTAVLCSYISTIDEIEQALTLLSKEITVFRLTGKVFNRSEVLNNFRDHPGPCIILLSPVGERDLDLPQAERIIIFDLINSVKTVYQKMKRGRGGSVIFLYHTGTSETIKTKRVLTNIMAKYPWSTIIHSLAELDP
ncbi:MAG: DEAD/DEAH box helicase family protein [Candidatus Kariarchaeaceae archaeon]